MWERCVFVAHLLQHVEEHLRLLVRHRFTPDHALGGLHHRIERVEAQIAPLAIEESFVGQRDPDTAPHEELAVQRQAVCGGDVELPQVSTVGKRITFILAWECTSHSSITS